VLGEGGNIESVKSLKGKGSCNCPEN
jgi:hypothetical protein